MADGDLKTLAPEAAARFTIRVAGGAEFPCYGDERVLVAMERSFHRPIPVGCRRGGCGVCRIRVIDGAYRTDAMSAHHVSADEKARGFALSCCVYPESDLVVEPAPKPKAPATTDARPTQQEP